MADIEVVRSCLLRELIEVQFVRGEGVPTNPVRVVTAYYDRDGNKLAENDPTLDGMTLNFHAINDRREREA